jgi:hypothetical protein
MRMIFTLIVGICSCLTLNAQSSATTVSFEKEMKPALVLDLPNTVDETEGTLLTKLKESGYNPQTKGSLFWKKNTVDGFYVFDNIRLTALGSETLDLYFKISKNKRSSKASTLHMLISNGEKKFISEDTDAGLWNDAQVFLNGFIDNAVAYKLEQEIKVQENKLKSLQSKLLMLQKDQKDLEDKIVRYQKELEVNKTRQVENEAEQENQARVLETTKSKRKE